MWFSGPNWELLIVDLSKDSVQSLSIIKRWHGRLVIVFSLCAWMWDSDWQGEASSSLSFRLSMWTIKCLQSWSGRQMKLGVAVSHYRWLFWSKKILWAQTRPMCSDKFLSRPFWSVLAVAQSVRWSVSFDCLVCGFLEQVGEIIQGRMDPGSSGVGCQRHVPQLAQRRSDRAPGASVPV